MSSDQGFIQHASFRGTFKIQRIVVSSGMGGAMDGGRLNGRLASGLMRGLGMAGCRSDG